MRVYLIAAPEDQAEAEKLAEYLKRFGVFIRTEFGQMAYPPAHFGEYTLALWSRNAMMSSRQMMLTNRAIDAWEEGRLIMARLEHGLSPRGLADLKMVDLTFAAAREHRYHDVLNAIRAMEDEHRRMHQEQAALVDAPPGGLEETRGLSMRAADADDGSEMLAETPPTEAPVMSAPPAQSPAPATQSGGASRLILLLLGLILVSGLGYLGVRLAEPPDDRASTPVVSGAQPPASAEGLGEVTREDLAQVRREIVEIEDEIARERVALMQLPSGTEEQRAVVAQKREKLSELNNALSEQIQTEEALVEQFQTATVRVESQSPASTESPTSTEQSPLNTPLIWGGLAAGLGLLALILFGALRRKPKQAVSTSAAPGPEPATGPQKEPTPAAPVLAAVAGHDAFVSYAHANAETVLPIVESIEESGISVWIDRDELRGGQNWAGQIVRAIKASDRFCLMCSAQAFESDHVRREVYLADKYGKTMVPIRLDESEMPEDIEYFLIGRQWVDVFEMDESDRSNAIKAILSNLEN